MKSFEEEIRAQRKAKGRMAMLWIGGGVFFVFVFELLIGAYILDGYGFIEVFCRLSWLDVFVESLLVILTGGAAWYFRGEQRDDLYTEIIGKSVFALKHFRDRIDDEIERMEDE